MGVDFMRRALLGLVTAFGLMLGSALPISAAVEVPVRIDCSDGDSLELTVDLDTLTALTDSVQAINDVAADLSCTLVQLSAPVTVVMFGTAAAAAQQTSGYVIGAGKVHAGCPDDTSQLFEGSFAVKMYLRDGGSEHAQLEADVPRDPADDGRWRTCLGEHIRDEDRRGALRAIPGHDARLGVRGQRAQWRHAHEGPILGERAGQFVSR
jgi:hypothetical protein